MVTNKQNLPVEKAKHPVPDDSRDIVLTHQEAEAAVPVDTAVCGEEDPGAALESLVTPDEDNDSARD